MNFSIAALEIPRWGVMWTLAGVLFLFAKLLTWFKQRPSDAPAWKHIAYLVAWPGMDADAFLNDASKSKPSHGEWLSAVSKTVFGGILVALSIAFEARDWLAGWVGLCGIVFLLHFGLFHMLSCVWRSLGVAAMPLMDWPIAAKSVAEFWDVRWNRAFHDLAGRFVFRPLVRRCGAAVALMTTFVFSGVVHDLVISIPAGGGYGLPTLYFTLQGTAVLVEHRLCKDAQGWQAFARWLLAFAVVALPVPLLFPTPFIGEVILPFVRDVGGCR